MSNRMLYLLLISIVLFFMFEKRKVSEEVTGSKHFYISNGLSKDVYILMHKDGSSKEDLETFVQMEDRFLEYEKESVHTGSPHIVPATILSNKIKERFPKYNFSYHAIHLKQIAEPTKTINRRI